MIIYYCLAIAMILPIILAFSSIPFRVKQLSSVNVVEPRAQAEMLTDAGARIVAAQKNAWEALLLFAVSLFIAFVNNVPANDIAVAAMIFIAARILHPIFYVLGLGILRMMSFATAFAAVLWIIHRALFV